MTDMLRQRLHALLDSEPSEEKYQRQVEQVTDRADIVLCRECAQVLSGEEIVFYEDRCNQCEGDWADDIAAWRRGEPVADARLAEFEAQFSAAAVIPVLQ